MNTSTTEPYNVGPANRLAVSMYYTFRLEHVTVEGVFIAIFSAITIVLIHTLYN